MRSSTQLKARLPISLFLFSLLFSLDVVQGQLSTQTFNFTGTDAQWVVPEDVYWINISALGASGGAGFYDDGGCVQVLGGGGLGANATGYRIPVSPGDILNVIVGGQGQNGSCNVGDGGGGGGTGVYNATSGKTLIVAGGGGGAGAIDAASAAKGGNGIAANGTLGDGGDMGTGAGAVAAGGGGAKSAGEDSPNAEGGGRGEPFGGSGGTAAAVGGSGGFGFGGGGGATNFGGGGGGGATGGDGGGGMSRAGQGGQSYVTSSASSMSFGQAFELDNGQVTISWTTIHAFCLLFEYNGASHQAWTVPAGVKSISIWASGGSGGNGHWDNSGTCVDISGGQAAQVLAESMPVTPGDILNIIVGGRGQNGACNLGDGGGGGGSAIYNTTTGATLVVAGGGGGAGGGDMATAQTGGIAVAANGSLGPGGSMGAGGAAAGAGGGGANSGGQNSTNANGGAQGLTTGGTGGNGASAGGNGGYGFGGGGGGTNGSGGGGGGATGGNGGGGMNRAGLGGQSYVSPIAGSALFSNAKSSGGGNVKIIYELEPIPTLSQWGLIILVLCLMIIGLVVVGQRFTHLTR